MIVTCERCSARYKLDDSKIKGRGARITCPKCQHVFVVYNKAQDEQPAEPDPELDSEEPSSDEQPVARSANPLAQDPNSPAGLVGSGPRADQIDFRKVGISTWKVKVKIGLVYDFSDIGTLRKYIQDRRVTEDDVISHDGASWVRIGDIPDLDAYFVQVYEELEDQLAGGVDEEADTGEPFEDDGPTMVVGMGSLRSNISTGVFQRPGAKTEGAPPSTRPLPGKPSRPRAGGPASDNNRFVDPFESLKERQRDRMRAKRRDGGPTTGTHRKNGKAAASDKNRRNMWLIAAAVMAVAAVVWFFFLRVPPQPVQPVEPGPTAQQPPATDPKEFQSKLIQQLEDEMRAAGVAPPTDGQQEEIQGPIITIDPAKRAEMCAKGELPASSCSDASTRPVAPTFQPSGSQGSNDVAKTTAADHAGIGRSAAQQRNWATAVTAYDQASRMEPGNATYRWGLAESLFRRGGSGDAERAQGVFQSLVGGNARAKKFLGLIADQLGDEAGAMDYLRQYEAAYPGDAEVKQKLQELTGG